MTPLTSVSHRHNGGNVYGCIQPIEMTGDLDCGQITERRFRVVPPDPPRGMSDVDFSSFTLILRGATA